MERNGRAVEQLRSGLNCSQAVVAGFAEGQGLDADCALRLSSGFGSGMGCTGGTCGAITGAVLVIGLLARAEDYGAASSKEHTYRLVQSFMEEFVSMNGATACRELLGCDISTAEGYAEAAGSDLFHTRCATYVEDAVRILEEIEMVEEVF